MDVGILNIVAVLFIFASILFLAFVFSKYFGNKASKLMKGKLISVEETISFGLDKQLHVVKIGSKYVLLASTGKNIQMLTEISSEEIDSSIGQSEEIEDSFNFKNYFEKYVDMFQSKLSLVNKKKTFENTKKYNNTGTNTKKNLDRIKIINNKLKLNSNFGDDFTYEKNKNQSNKEL